MPIYGYSKRVANEHGLHEMSEVTFHVPAKDLRRIAMFLVHCADHAESGNPRWSHFHLRQLDRQWNQDHPDSDVIVSNPAPDPSARVD